MGRTKTVRLAFTGAFDLRDLLDEIERNVHEAQGEIEPGATDDCDMRLTAGAVDNLRCIVEDAEDKLRPIYEKLDTLWDTREAQLIPDCEDPTKFRPAKIVKGKRKKGKKKS